MGSGLSMASVNKIKELAGAHEYGLALDIVDSQDLSKSLNPQFLRLCGDIYTYNGRYTDARKVLLMAHRIAPEAKRIIFSLMELYLKLGYRELAKTYYDMYLFDADMEALETKQLLYVYKKANHAPVEDLEKYLGTEYLETIDYEWSYETFLVYTLLDKQQEALSLALEYTAHYTDAPHCHVVADALEGLISVEDVFYPDMPDRQDDDPDQEEIRQHEQKLLEADNLRMYPPEPEIVSMVDDREDIIDFGAKRKRKRFMKEQSEEASETDDAGEGQSEDNLSEEDSGSFMKRAFSKFRLKKTEDEDAGQETPTDTETDKPEEKTADSVRESTPSESGDEEISSAPNFVLVETPETDKTTDAESLKEANEDEASEPADESEEYGEPKSVEEAEEYETSESVEEHDISGAEDEEVFDDLEDLSDIQEMLNNKRQTAGDEHGGIEDAEMKEHFWNKHNARYGSVVTDDLEEDSFEAEADSVEGLHEESSRDDAESSYRRKSTVVFEDATVVEEDDDDTPVDDFSSHDYDEFGTMHTVDDDEYDGVFVGEVEGLDDEPEEDAAEDIETEANAYGASEAHEKATEAYTEEESYVDTAEKISETDTEETEAATEFVTESETESEIETETESETETEAEVYESLEAYEEATEAYTEAEPYVDTAEEISETDTEETEAATEFVTESEAETEIGFETESETESEIEAETESETESETETEAEVYESFETYEEVPDMTVHEEDAVEETEPEESYTSFTMYENPVPPKKEPAYEPWKDIKKSNLDFPVFRSSLFPEYHSDTTKVENRFGEIMEEKNSKLQENLRKEEQLQRETEALLASLGIDLSLNTKSTAAAYEKPATAYKDTAGTKKGPSRDELKASLKIDSAKKDILRKIKEYR